MQMNARDINQIVGECAGAVSVCWTEIGNAGIFESSQAAKHVEDALAEIEAAGYRKPRTITTAKELDEMPSWSVVRSDEATIWEKFNGGHRSEDFWGETLTHGKHPSSHIALPATVLYEGEI
jgi:hypothetical protein